jgi:hypothetical protein
MKPTGMVVNTAGLTDRQRLFVSAFIESGSISDASDKAGYADASGGYQALKSEIVQRALHDYRERLIKTEGATLGYKTMLELARPGNPGGVRFSAAKYLMDAAGHGAKVEDGGKEKPLHEMTEAQLQAFVEKMRQLEAADRPVITVIPDGSAGNPGTTSA